MKFEKFKKRALRKLGLTGRHQEWYLGKQISREQPVQDKGSVIFAGLSDSRLGGGGKVSAASFLPPFCEELRANGYKTHFVTTMAGLKNAIGAANRSIVVLIYREVGEIPEQPDLPEVLDSANIVFNHPDMGRIISNKKMTNDYLTQRGILMPQVKKAADGKVFSNAEHASGAETQVLDLGDDLDETRYNTEFIDTRYEYGGKSFYTTVRLMCIGGVITHFLVRARDVSEGDASVHAKDNPLDPELFNSYYDNVVLPNMDGLKKISKDLGDALGLGFYSHDVLIEVGTNRIMMCETGYKFDDMAYSGRMKEIIGGVPSLKGFEGAAQIARSSAPSFIKLIQTS